MPSRRFVTLRCSVPLLALPLLLAAATTASAQQTFRGTVISACEGTIGCPNKVNLKTPVDTLQFQAQINPETPLHPSDDKFKIVLRNLNGELLSLKLEPGLIVREGSSFVYRNDAARQSGGISRVTLRRKQAHQWRITVIAHGDLSGATLEQMTVYLVIGNDTFLTKNVWSEREFGWLLHLPATAPTPGPTGSPVVPPTAAPTGTPAPTPTPLGTPTPTIGPPISPSPSPTPTPVVTPPPTPTPTPVPTPTSEPYGSVFEAFVSAPSSLLK